MELTRREKAFVIAFATSVVALLAASSITGSSVLNFVALIPLLPWYLALYPIILLILGIAHLFTAPMRAVGFEGVADAIATALGTGSIWALFLATAIGQGLVLILGWRTTRRCLFRGRDRYCRHARSA